MWRLPETRNELYDAKYVAAYLEKYSCLQNICPFFLDIGETLLYCVILAANPKISINTEVCFHGPRHQI